MHGMSAHPLLSTLADLVLGQMPELTRNLQESIQQALKHRHLGLQEAWNRRRSRFQFEFDTSLRPLLAQARQGQDALAPKRSIGMEQLALVDEHQALRDVGIAHVVELVTEASRQELFQLNNFFAGLARKETRPAREPNLLRPALFARALADAFSGNDLRADGHYALMQAAAPAMAGALVPVYRALAAELQRQNLTALVSTQDLTKGERRAFGSVPGALDDLRQRVESIESRRTPLGDQSPPAKDLLNRLYEQMLADPHLLPPVKAHLARLQVVVARMAQFDPELLRQQDHPTWRLINAVAAYGAAFTDASDPRLRDFLHFLDDQTQMLLNAPVLGRQQFENLQRLVDAFIARQARERSTPSTAALAALERERLRKQWATLLHEQLDAQLHSARISPSVREFLLGIWVDVIVQAMVLDGHEAESVQGLVHVVDELVESLQPVHSEIERLTLRQRLPALIARIDHGLHAIALSDLKREAILNGLAAQHARALRGVQAEPRRREPPRVQPRADVPLEAQDSEMRRLLDERDSQYASVWAHAEVNRAELPTQPMPLPHSPEGQTRASIEQWLRQLAVGGWFHMFIQSHWLTTQLVWISEERQFYAFVGQDLGDRHSLTAGALEQLFANGLVMYLEQEGLLERAVATLMQDLGP